MAAKKPPATMQRIVAKLLAGSPLAGQAPAFIRAAAPYGLDPRILVGIAMQESSLGKAQFAPHNPFGYNVHRSSSAPGPAFPSYEASASAVAKTLAGSLYKGAGKRTLASIIPTYAPAGADGNNPSAYIQRVSRFLGLDPNQNVFGPPGAAVGAAALPGGSAGPSSPAAPPGPTPSPAAPQYAMGAPSVDWDKLSRVLASSDKQVAAGAYKPGSLIQPLLGTIIPGRMQQVPAAPVSPAPAKPAPGPRLGPLGGAVYGGILGKKGSIIGTPYAGTHTLGNWESDDAVDVAVPVGTPVYAPKAGVIGPQFGSLGSSGRFQGIRLHLKIPGNELYYAHLSKTAPGIKPGVRVRAGQLLGYTGSANGVAHLHLGIEKGDPRKVLGL